MYAVISSGGKQYRLSEGDLVDVERIGGQVGDPVIFDQVLFIGDGDSGNVGEPVVEGARVLGTIVDQGRGDKVIVFKFKRRKMYRRKTGHRQELTRVRIESIQPEGKAVEVPKETVRRPIEETEPEAKKPAKKPRKTAKAAAAQEVLSDEPMETASAAQPPRAEDEKTDEKRSTTPATEPVKE